MKICYIDEAGCTGRLANSTSEIQPTLVITGLIIDYSEIHKATSALLDIKQRFYPKLLPSTSSNLDWIKAEIKGSELRKDACSTSRNKRRHSYGVMKELCSVIEESCCKIVGRVWIKEIGASIKSDAIYTYSIQSIYTDFQRLLQENNELGVVVADSRLKHLNNQVAHSIFTQKFKGTGDSYDRVIELPAFSHSDNHAGLQLADVLCSALVTPVAIESYVRGHVESVHVREKYAQIKDEFKDRIRAIQYRYNEASGKTRGGLIVSDGISKRPGGDLFR